MKMAKKSDPGEKAVAELEALGERHSALRDRARQQSSRLFASPPD